MSEIGHNSGETADTNGLAVERLRSVIERYERLDEERKALMEDQKDLMAEAKSAGFDTKVVKIIIQRRAKERAELEELDTLVEVYERALS